MTLATLGGAAVTLVDGASNPSIKDAIGQRTTANLDVWDSAGTGRYQRGTPVQLFNDTTGELVYAGVVLNDSFERQAYSTDLYHAIDASDWHYLANKRIVATSYSGQTCGFMVNDVINNWLDTEGVYAVKNVLSANQSNVETDTSGFATTGTGTVTLTRDTTTSWQGAASLKCVTDGTATSQGWNAVQPSTVFQPNTSYTLSVYLKGSGTLRFFLYQQSPSTVIGTAQTITLTGTWTRYTVIATTPKPLVATNYGLRVDTDGTPQAVTFWADGLQIEPTPAGTFAAWTNLFSAQQSDIEGADLSVFDAGSGVTISQDTTQQQHGAASLKVVTNGSGTFQQVATHAPIASFTPGQTVTISAYIKGAVAGGTLNFVVSGAGVGYINGATSVTLTTGWQRVTRTVALPGSFSGITGIGIRVDTGSTAQALTFWIDALQIEAGPALHAWTLGGTTGYETNVSPWEQGGTSTVQTGPTLSGSIAFNYKPASAVLDKLAQLAGFVWWIDRYKRLYFVAPATVAAPWTFDGTQADLDKSLTLELTNPLYRNGQWILGTTEVTAPQTETRKGDGATRSFTFSYPLHETPSAFTVDGVSKTLGIKGVDTGKDFYWSKGDPTIAQDTSGTILTSANTISMTYKGEFKTVTFSQDSDQVGVQAAIEGSTSGLVEDVQTDTSLVTSSQAFQLASSYLAKYATSGETLKFTTKTTGLRAGQLLTVNLPAPWSVNDTYLIESVNISFDGINWWYDVNALSGPVNDTWIQFFTRLATQNSVIDTESAGTQQMVALLQQFTAAWTWAATLNATVTACPLFPWTFPVTFC